MPNYDFLILSPVEFENLSADIIEHKLGLKLELFAQGKDQGIDLRYAKVRGNDIIVQCKRYAQYKELLRTLKKEVPKVKRLNPGRYIITTSVSLTANQKDEIVGLFEPYIISPSDILGREQLNKELGDAGYIEQRHYKLWLSSLEVMKRVLHADVANQSDIEVREMKKTLRTYAQNESLTDAIEILKKKKFVIISGIPGVGKTTLARILVHWFLGKERYEEFIYVSKEIDQAYKLYNPQRRQIFLFDDFLGSNYLAQRLERNEDNRISKFINLISESKKSAIILTTREYILKQAQGDYALLEGKAFEDGKYVLELSKYNNLTKAQILYNHLFVADLPQKYIHAFLQDETYKKVIRHRNYSPRHIETILKDEVWLSYTPEEFPGAFLSFLDNPQRLWRHVYENEISDNAQAALKVLFTTTAPISWKDLVAACDSYFSYVGSRVSRPKIEKALKELDGTFIDIAQSESGAYIDYINPSVYDFLLRYYASENRAELLNVIRSAIFLNQLTETFTYSHERDELIVLQDQVVLGDDDGELREAIALKLLEAFDSLGWSATPFHNIGILSIDHSVYARPDFVSKIYKVLFSLGFESDSRIREFCLQKYIVYLEKLSSQENEWDSKEVRATVSEAIQLFNFYKNDLPAELAKVFLEDIAFRISDVNGLSMVDDLLEDDDSIAKQLNEDIRFMALLDGVLHQGIGELEYDQLDDYIDEVLPAIERFGIDKASLEESIDEQRRLLEQWMSEDEYEDDHVPSLRSGLNGVATEEQLIDAMFESLAK